MTAPQAIRKAGMGIARDASGSDTPSRGLPLLHFGIPEAVTLCLYAALLAWAIAHHEPWADEAQAWQIARTLPLTQMLRALSYEVHPALWYLCLWVMARLHVSYAGMHWITGLIAFAGISLLVLAAPFPRFLKLLLPFTFYLAYQYAVVARSYVLVPLLLFLCAYFWPQRFKRPLLISLLLGLLANVVLHAAMISAGLAIVLAVELWLKGKAARARIDLKRFFAAAVLLSAFYGFAIRVALPAKDTIWVPINVPTPNSTVVQEQQRRESHQESSKLLFLKWVAAKVQARVERGLTDGLIHSFWLGCLFWLMVTWKLGKTRQLLYLVPAVLFVAFSAAVYAKFWHTGLMLPSVIMLLWMTWPEEETPFLKLPLYEQWPVLILFVIALVQISWAEFAFQFDHGHDYAAGKSAAAFLAPYVRSHAGIVQTGDDFLAVDVQPYFDHNIFLNQPYAYSWWSTRNPARFRYQELLRQQPEIVVLAWRFNEFPTPADILASTPMVTQLTMAGYRNTQKFCGGLVQPGRQIQEWNCELIYQPR
jgi:hypothetical protein